MKLLIIGAGYVGLVTATCFAAMGHQVICYDCNAETIESLKRLELHIYEPRLEEMVKANVEGKRLLFTSDLASAFASVDVCFIAVGSPPLPSGHADLRPVLNVAKDIATHIKGNIIVVMKSTVPVGTSALVAQEIETFLNVRGVDYKVKVVSNPEFLCEGSALEHCLRPNRVIVGSNDEEAIATLQAIYAPFMHNRDRLIVMDPASAELTKYAANAMLALRISFMNELSSLCEATGADICKVRLGIGSDERIGYGAIYAGPGFGGSCFPKDLSALEKQFEENNLQGLIVEAAAKVNVNQKQVMAKKIIDYFQDRKPLGELRLGVLGLSFKPETDDVRESASLELVKQLIAKGVSLQVYDPKALANAKKEMTSNPHIIWCNDLNSCAKGTDALVLMTEWKEFRHLDFEGLQKLMCNYVLFDARNLFQPENVTAQGYDYISIGRPDAFASR